MPPIADGSQVIVLRAPRGVLRLAWRLLLVALLVVIGVLVVVLGGPLGWVLVALGAMALGFEILQARSSVVVGPTHVEVRGPLSNRGVPRDEIVEIDPRFRGDERLRRPPQLVLRGGRRVPLNPFEEPWRRVSPKAEQLAGILGLPSDTWKRIEGEVTRLPGRRR